jgi:hypothetical protein
MNVNRRHLDESRRAMFADNLATMRKGNQPNAQFCALAQDEAAKLLKVSRRSVQHARKVREHGTPELIAAVEQGVMRVSAAAGIVHRTPEQQIARIERDRAKAAGEHRHDQDWYRTPEEEAEKVYRAEQAFGGFSETVWECACGDGPIARVLLKHGHKVIATDLYDRGYVHAESGLPRHD